MSVYFDVRLLDLHVWTCTIPSLAEQLPGCRNRNHDCNANPARGSIYAMDKPSDKNSSGNSSRDDKNAELLKQWRTWFVPSETSIDGGLFPARLGKSMVGLGDYDDLELSGELAELPGLDEETRAKLQDLLARTKKK